MAKAVQGASAGKGPDPVTRFLADENFRIEIIRGVLRQDPTIDIVRAQDVNLGHTPDPIVLERAAEMDRVLLTHDYRDMPLYIVERLRGGLPMPGVVQVPWSMPIGPAIDDLLLLIGGNLDSEWENQVHHLPLPRSIR